MCRYKTSTRQSFTFGGESTYEEMCFNFLLYYPRHPVFKMCSSMPYLNDLIGLFDDLSKLEIFLNFK